MPRMRLAAALMAALLFSACGITSLPLPFQSTPTPAPATPRPTATPTPTPTPLPIVEVKSVKWGPNARAGEHGVSIAFLLRNPSTALWLLQGVAQSSVFTPDGRPLPQARQTVQLDLGPGEERWYAMPEVATFASVVGKVAIAVSGGQWLEAPIYPYPGGVPVTAAVEGPTAAPRTAAPAPTPAGTPTPPPSGTPAPTPARPSVAVIVTNTGELGVQGVVRGFSFSTDDSLLGILECGNALYAARSATRISCLGTRPEALGGRLVFAVYPDLRPIIVIPTPTPTGQTPPATTPTAAPATPTPAATATP